MNTQIIRPPTPIKSGMMLPWPTNTPPRGWLLCFGQAISRAGYAGLFTAIGTTFGVGNGSTTFNLPDYRGRVPLGKDNMGGASANRVTNAQADTIGGAAGDEALASHVHNTPYQVAYSGSDTKNLGTIAGSGTVYNINTDSAGSGVNNMIPYLTLNYIIKI